MTKSKKEANATLRAARNALDEFTDQQVRIHGRGNVPESAEGDRLNQAVIDAEPAASSLARWMR